MASGRALASGVGCWLVASGGGFTEATISHFN